MKRHAYLICALLLVSLFGSFAQAQTLTFTVETTTSSGTAVVPRLTWSTAPALAQCVASAVPAATDWTGPKGTQGTALLAAITATRSYTMSCNWPGNLTALVRVTRPTTNSDGSPLTNLAGYRIQYGRAADALDESVYIADPAQLTWTSPQLAPGAWFFAARSVNTQGLEGGLSPIATKTLTAGASQTRTLEVAVRFPSPPIPVTAE